ncbi:MAG: hypothetical protein AAGF47_03945 [Planctomycetota bacterium]
MIAQFRRAVFAVMVCAMPGVLWACSVCGQGAAPRLQLLVSAAERYASVDAIALEAVYGSALAEYPPWISAESAARVIAESPSRLVAATHRDGRSRSERLRASDTDGSADALWSFVAEGAERRYTGSDNDRLVRAAPRSGVSRFGSNATMHVPWPMLGRMADAFAAADDLSIDDDGELTMFSSLSLKLRVVIENETSLVRRVASLARDTAGLSDGRGREIVAVEFEGYLPVAGVMLPERSTVRVSFPTGREDVPVFETSYPVTELRWTVNPPDTEHLLRTTPSDPSWNWLDAKTSDVYDREGGTLLYNRKEQDRAYLTAYDSGRTPRRVGLVVIAVACAASLVVAWRRLTFGGGAGRPS